TIKVKPHF
nr:zona pellucida-binding protein, AWN-1=C1 fragment [swine, sperm, Peptide Partial, 8 aa] [Sus scrofa]